MVHCTYRSGVCTDLFHPARPSSSHPHLAWPSPLPFRKIKLSPAGPDLSGRLKTGLVHPVFLLLLVLFISWLIVLEESEGTPETESHQKNSNVVYIHVQCKYQNSQKITVPFYVDLSKSLNSQCILCNVM